MIKRSEQSGPKKKLHRRLAASLFVVLLAATSIGTAIAYFVGLRFIARSDSLAAMPIVRMLASELSSEPQLDQVRILTLGRKATDLLPGVRLYLVTTTGEIAVDLSADSSRPIAPVVDPKAIMEFAHNEFWNGQPSYTEDPVAPGSQALFVAASSRIGETPYLVLAILNESIAWATTDEALDQALGPYALIVLGTLLAISGLSFLCIFFLITRPLRHVMELFREYERGNFSARVVIPGNDELHQLADNAHTMAQTIERQIRQISERDEIRRDLIGGISHDLRTPIATLRLEVSSLTNDNVIREHPRLLERTQKLERNLSSLGRLLGQLFELAKLEAQEAPPELVAYPIGELLLEMKERFEGRAQEHKISLIKGIVDSQTEVTCDPALVERVLTNLIENALTYTLPGGTVSLSAEAGPNEMVISVTDSGVGIAVEEHELIFQRSYRSSRWEARRRSSAGLGLAIVKKLLEVQGSSVSLSSEEGKGSCFSFSMPLA